MPKCIKSLKWKCGHCKEIYDNKSEAIECEEKCRTKNVNNEFIKYFPIRSKKDDKYKKHCVSCDTLLREFERDWDGYDRATIGQVIYEIAEREEILNGLYCLKCAKKLKQKLLRLMKNDSK